MKKTTNPDSSAVPELQPSQISDSEPHGRAAGAVSREALEPIPIIYQDEDFVVIDKPPGMHVHQPEFPRRRVPPEITCLYRLRRQIKTYLYPVHRLDVGTSGLLLFALNKETASMMCKLFTTGEVSKDYIAIARGYVKDEGTIAIPLESDSSGELLESVTHFRTLARVELPHAVGRRHSTARYSLVQARPDTGRFHQIRRHFARLSHPLIGDAAHGDSHHNRFFRETLGFRGLWLRAVYLEFTDPRNGRRHRFQAPLPPRWEQIMEKLDIAAPDVIARM